MIKLVLELRWFIKGRCGEEILKRTKEKGFKANSQDDIYLTLPENHAKFIGVKSSRGTFDIKYKTKFYDITIDDIEVRGRVETWSKCNLDLKRPKGYKFQQFNIKKHKPVYVNKIRNTKSFEISYPDFKIEPVKRVNQGIKFEITTIEANNTDWWSVAFDCFGEKEEIQKSILPIGIKEVLKDFPEIIPKLTESKSYPEWISKLTK